MSIELSEIIKAAEVVALAFMGWMWREYSIVKASIEVHRQEHQALRTHIAEKYVSKDDFKDALDRVYDGLQRIEKKIDERND